MKDTLQTVIVMLFVSILVLLGWNILLQIKYRRLRRPNEVAFNELKYQQQFYIAVFATIIGVLVFMGYDKYDALQKNITTEIETKTQEKIKKYTNQIDSLAKDIKYTQREIVFENTLLQKSNEHLGSQTDKANDMLFKIMFEFANMKNDLYTSKQQLQSQIDKVKEFNNDIEELKKIEFLNQIYLVTGRNFREGALVKYTDTVHFSDLNTLNGHKLPKFKSSPSVLLSKTTGYDLFITKITKDFFILNSGNSYDLPSGEVDERKYDLLIIYKDSK